MIVVVASGKGGTGKTTLAVNMAAAVAADHRIRLLDADVEEPDCHLYIRPPHEETIPVGVPIPIVDSKLCDGCGLCARTCRFKALIALPREPLLFPELCHGCGACTYACPRNAISEQRRPIGAIKRSYLGRLEFAQGVLNVGETRTTPLIQALKQLGEGRQECDGRDTVIDAPPGASCAAVETLKGADFAVLVTEPTPFGLNDLRLIVEAVRKLEVPFGVVVNRMGLGDCRVQEYCAEEDIPVLMEIPDDRRIAVACSRGEIAALEYPSLAEGLRSLFARVTGP